MEEEVQFVRLMFVIHCVFELIQEPDHDQIP
jgi:hypothetical protein